MDLYTWMSFLILSVLIGITISSPDSYILSLQGEDQCFKALVDFPVIVFSKHFISDTDFTGHAEHNKKVGTGFEDLNACRFESAIKAFNDILQKYPNNFHSLVGKGLAVSRKDFVIGSVVDVPSKYISKALTVRSTCCLAIQSQAEVSVLAGKYEAALLDANKSIKTKQNSVIYTQAAMICYKSNKLGLAATYLKSALKFPTQSFQEIHLYLGLCYISMGQLKESISAFKDALEIQPDNLNALHSIALAFKESGDAYNTVHHLDMAAKDHPTSAKTWMLRGHLHFSIGSIDEALKDYKKCLSLQPQHRTCLYMKGLCLASGGQFFEGVKAVTQVMVINLESSYLPEFHQSLYLREYSRYWHSHLDTPLDQFQTDEELNDRFRDSWVKNLPFNILNYTEQIGIKPHIHDIEYVSFAELSTEAQILLCKAEELAPLLTTKIDGQPINQRTIRALSLAMLQVAQTAKRFWKSPKEVKGWKGRRMSWRDIVNIGAVWIKLTSLGFPIVWIDTLPEKTLKAGFITQMVFRRGEKRMVRFHSYQPNALQIAKAMIQTVTVKTLPPKAKDQLRHSTTCHDVLAIVNTCAGPLKQTLIKQFASIFNRVSTVILIRLPLIASKYMKHVSSSKSGFKVSLKLQSMRPKAPMLEGVSMWLKGERDEDITFSMETKTTPARINQFNAELEFVWARLTDSVPKNKDQSSHLVIAILHYLCNLIPLSKDSGSVAYAVTLGLFLALGKEATTAIPESKQIEMEALFSRSPDTFSRKILPWLGLKRSSFSVDELPSVSETFRTARDILEILNVEVGSNCVSNKK